jgi:hypothetical protein
MAETTIRADRAETRCGEWSERRSFCKKGRPPRRWKNICWFCATIRKTTKFASCQQTCAWRRAGDGDAVRLLGELFERQVNAGDATRASLTYKKLARHGSPTWEQKFRFGQLLEGSNKKLAVGTYESALGDLAKLPEKKKDALQILGSLGGAGPGSGKFSAHCRAVVRDGREQGGGRSV